MLDVKVRGAEELRRVARALRQADRDDLRRGVTKAIREGGRETLDDLRKSVRELPIRGFPYPGRRRRFLAPHWSRSHSLRDDVAAGLTLAVKVSEDAPSVRFRASGKRVHGTHGDSLPRRLDSAAGWRHPVLGNREVWVKQEGKPWFGHTIYRDRPKFEERIGRVLDEVRQKIERA